jgi:hypothetical protein
MSNVPQDVIDDAVAAKLLMRGYLGELVSPWKEDTDLSEYLMKFLQLRAQRQQGSEPVYQMQAVDGHWVTLDKEHYEGVVNDTTFQTRILYTATPDMVAGLVMAAEICEQEAEGSFSIAKSKVVTANGRDTHNAAGFGAKNCAALIRSAIPADGEAALRERDFEMCMKVADEVYTQIATSVTASKIPAIVNSIIGASRDKAEGGK